MDRKQVDLAIATHEQGRVDKLRAEGHEVFVLDEHEQKTCEWCQMHDSEYVVDGDHRCGGCVSFFSKYDKNGRRK